MTVHHENRLLNEVVRFFLLLGSPPLSRSLPLIYFSFCVALFFSLLGSPGNARCCKKDEGISEFRHWWLENFHHHIVATYALIRIRCSLSMIRSVGFLVDSKTLISNWKMSDNQWKFLMVTHNHYGILRYAYLLYSTLAKHSLLVWTQLGGTHWVHSLTVVRVHQGTVEKGTDISEFRKKFSLMVTHCPIRNENFGVNERADRANHREREHLIRIRA